MLAGVKIIPRDKIDKDGQERKKKKSRSSKGKRREKRRSSSYSSSDDDLERIKRGSRKKKKWYSSNEESSSYSDGSKSESSSEQDGRKHRSRRKNKKTKYSSSDDDRASLPLMENETLRKEIGLEWMLRPKEKTDARPPVNVEHQPDEEPADEIKVNPKELNPYLTNNGGGYPEDADGSKRGGDQLLSSSLVGDGGASWRLKALKRAKEQAAREGLELEEVVSERWGSLGQLAVSTASHPAAPPRAHLYATKSRKKGIIEEEETKGDSGCGRNTEKNTGRGNLNASLRHREMKAPRVHDSLAWGKQRRQKVSTEDAGVISDALSSLNKFSNDGNFMQGFIHQQSTVTEGPGDSSLNDHWGNEESELIASQRSKQDEDSVVIEEGLSANQVAAKALQLRMKGKHSEAEKLLKEAENLKAKHGVGDKSVRSQHQGSTSRHFMQDISVRQKKMEDSSDMYLAKRIMQNKQFSLSGQADDEYDFEDAPHRKSRRKGASDGHKVTRNNIEKRILTEQERCLFCFENRNRPEHLVISIANFTYLMLPKWQPVVSGHCCILPMQHVSATRNVENNVWEELRNFKKCLIMMFARQEKEVVFLETVMGLARQRRHCLIECIPLPQEIAKQAPLYFKKAIDEAEDEWSQHNAKKLIDTSKKGLRGSIPENFPYFHVEFGLNRGFVHVIDDETQFRSSFGLDVIRGMLRLPEEDMHRRRRYDSVEVQKQAVREFARDWEPFDWTKQLD